MKLKLISLAAFAVWLSMGTSMLSVSATERQPRIEVSERTFNMGTLALGQTGYYRLRVRNVGSAPLVIGEIKPG